MVGLVVVVGDEITESNNWIWVNTYIFLKTGRFVIYLFDFFAHQLQSHTDRIHQH